ncbi:MAG: ATP-NAD kinase family protein, partial [Anaerolineaceae bacterium]|nr:ATP-NAD kinase family protein [Anaerolineaceae bacterium]
MKRIGLIVNPIAGMGGVVGLKGTDDGMHINAIELGAKPVTPDRTKDLLSGIQSGDQMELWVAPGKMGENYVKEFDFQFHVIGSIGDETTAEDTILISKEMTDLGVELIIFVGGDGTARDLFDAIGTAVPVVAVPSGVKIFSGVFAINALAAAHLVDAFINGADISEEEVHDIDEEAYRDNKLDSHLYGYLSVPKVQEYIQASKSPSSQNISSAENMDEVAEWIIEKMDDHTLYLLGPGTTVRAITNRMGLHKTLLGIDALNSGEIIGFDLNEEKIFDLLGQYPDTKIIVTPIGGNGFIFGRGNKQFSPGILKTIGKKNIIVIGTYDKIKNLDCLRVDT